MNKLNTRIQVIILLQKLINKQNMGFIDITHIDTLFLQFDPKEKKMLYN